MIYGFYGHFESSDRCFFPILCVLGTSPGYGQSRSADDLLIEADDRIAQGSSPSEASEAGPDRINYTGIGGVVGLSDDGKTALGDGGFSLVGRLSLTGNLSIHTASVLADEGIFSAALTGGAPVRDQSTGRTLAFPFVGAGIAIETEDFDTVDPLATGGIDVPLNRTVTGTARINAAFTDEGTDVGLVLGVGVDVFDLIF